MKTKSKPCPFCGSGDTVFDSPHGNDMHAVCRSCGATGPIETPRHSDDPGFADDIESRANDVWSRLAALDDRNNLKVIRELNETLHDLRFRHGDMLRVVGEWDDPSVAKIDDVLSDIHKPDFVTDGEHLFFLPVGISFKSQLFPWNIAISKERTEQNEQIS